jgi:hypothetical protein
MLVNVLRAGCYVRRIKNPDKRAYADQYLQYLLGQVKPEPERGALSVMAAQAVRLQLTAYFDK